MNQEWIEYPAGVPSSKPTFDKAVIVYSPIEGMGIAALEKHYAKDNEWCWLYRRTNDSMLVHNVTHWMPLPDPPGKDGD